MLVVAGTEGRVGMVGSGGGMGSGGRGDGHRDAPRSAMEPGSGGARSSCDAHDVGVLGVVLVACCGRSQSLAAAGWTHLRFLHLHYSTYFLASCRLTSAQRCPDVLARHVGVARYCTERLEAGP